MIKGKIIDEQLRIPLYITTIFLCINLVLGISQAIAYGCQKSWLVTLTISMISLLNIINVSILLFTGIPQSLIVFSISNGMATVLPNIFLFIILKRKNMFVIENVKRIRCNKEIYNKYRLTVFLLTIVCSYFVFNR